MHLSISIYINTCSHTYDIYIYTHVANQDINKYRYIGMDTDTGIGIEMNLDRETDR